MSTDIDTIYIGGEWVTGTVWSPDHDHAVAVATRIHSGTVGINHYLPDIAAPYGGIKDSGLGRELGPEGLQGFQNLKSVFLC